MTSTRPYLIRALYEWMVDNGLTPHLLVDATAEDTLLPSQYVTDGRIILNISPRAVQGLELGNDRISFSARFSGRETFVALPPEAVISIYARENSHGMLFTEETAGDDAAEERPEPPGLSRRPSLKVVK